MTYFHELSRESQAFAVNSILLCMLIEGWITLVSDTMRFVAMLSAVYNFLAPIALGDQDACGLGGTGL
jgi:hypothetical protein